MSDLEERAAERVYRTRATWENWLAWAHAARRGGDPDGLRLAHLLGRIASARVRREVLAGFIGRTWRWIPSTHDGSRLSTRAERLATANRAIEERLLGEASRIWVRLGLRALRPALVAEGLTGALADLHRFRDARGSERGPAREGLKVARAEEARVRRAPHEAHEEELTRQRTREAYSAKRTPVTLPPEAEELLRAIERRVEEHSQAGYRLTATRIAEVAGVSPSVLTRLLRREGCPTGESIGLLTRALAASGLRVPVYDRPRKARRS